MEKYICIHGHFYQPPRENPWLEEVELQDSASPYHDWNERITAECYAPNNMSRVLDGDGKIIDMINNYSRISFNFGPTLMSWLERHKPDVHGEIVKADRESMERFSGHGSAISQVYNHIIMPLANERDKKTQVIWGIEDFKKRFGREPEGMWLSETAVNIDSLEVLADHGIKYTILAPRQAHKVRRLTDRVEPDEANEKSTEEKPVSDDITHKHIMDYNHDHDHDGHHGYGYGQEHKHLHKHEHEHSHEHEDAHKHVHEDENQSENEIDNEDENMVEEESVREEEHTHGHEHWHEHWHTHEHHWQDVSDSRVDPSTPYLCKLPSGKTITLFFYDGPISQDIAFDGMLKSGDTFARRLLTAFSDERSHPQLVHVANDGETFGHHHYRGDMALAYCLYLIEDDNFTGQHIKLTNYGEFLEKHPPLYEVEIYDNSSWSCVHGVGRWKENCGCHTGMRSDWNQHWRAPLREALDWLRDILAPYYELEAGKIFEDPWEARDGYIDILFDRSNESIDAFFKKYANVEVSQDDKVKAIKLLELQRNAMLMYTSCAWFFDEISGIETVQVMNYALRVIQYYEELTGQSIEDKFLEKLALAPSNLFENGANVYDMFVKPAKIDLLRVGAHYAISSLFENYGENTSFFCFNGHQIQHSIKENGKMKMATGITKITSIITREAKEFMFAVFHMGDHNVNCGVIESSGEEAYFRLHGELETAFELGQIPKVIRIISSSFGQNSFTLWNIFRDEQRNVLDIILNATYKSIEASYRQVYDNNYAIMSCVKGMDMSIPDIFKTSCQYVLTKDLINTLQGKDLEIARLKRIINEIQKWHIEIDRSKIDLLSITLIDNLMDILKNQYNNIELIGKITETIELLKEIHIEPNLWHAQNAYYIIGKEKYAKVLEMAEKGEVNSKNWIEAFNRLGNYMEVKLQ